jgi:DnaJ-class molecular chaperone
MRNFYSVLQVKPKASDVEIKAAFRNLAKSCHPDLRPGDKEAEQAFREAKRAYTFLRNPETRKMYDTFLAEQRAAEWDRRRQSALAMSGAFVITTTAAAILVMTWLNAGGFPIAGGRVAGASKPGTIAEMANTPPEMGPARSKAEAGPAPLRVSERPAGEP